ncbi:MAG: glycosyltransferase family 4 protein [Bacteroidia bacterium]
MRTKVIYIISHINKALAFEWIAQEINKEKIQLSFILLNSGPSNLEDYLEKNGFEVKRIIYKNKYNLPLALARTIRHLIKAKPDVIHTHLFDANIIGLVAGKLCGIKKRIYTRHHSSYHHEYFPHAVKYDKLCNVLSTDIIAISTTVKEILIRENVAAEKISLIHHGFKIELFGEVDEKRILSLKNKYNKNTLFPVIGIIARYTEWKGIQYTISAFKTLLKDHPRALLILANAEGDYKNSLQRQLKEIPRDNYVEVKFENDLFALYKLFNVFVHVPINKHSEAFGQTYVEALAAGVPSVFTLSGIANDFVKNERNALVVDYMNSEQILQSIKRILSDDGLRTDLISNGKKDVLRLFPLNKMIFELEKLYLK